MDYLGFTCVFQAIKLKTPIKQECVNDVTLFFNHVTLARLNGLTFASIIS